jgi:succinate dehydrogenase flavin-adding protein (antitoxin of CptAB toxin-antitoxin module)
MEKYSSEFIQQLEINYDLNKLLETDNFEQENFQHFRKLFESEDFDLIQFVFDHDYSEKYYGDFFYFVLSQILADFRNWKMKKDFLNYDA